MVEKINLGEKLSKFEDLWSPKIIADLNGQQVKPAKLSGEFTWHFHETEDELFLVLGGTLRILFRDGELSLNEGELCVIPRGVEQIRAIYAAIVEKTTISFEWERPERKRWVAELRIRS